MVEISHQKAQVFLHTAADNMLPADNQPLLDAHLAECQECRKYANHLHNLESGLSRIMHTHCDNQRPVLNLQTVINPPATKIIWNSFVGLTQGMGKVTIVAALVLGYFLIANISNNQITTLGTEVPTILPTPNELPFNAAISPTPSAQLALTELTMQVCETIIHVAQSTDTLESIATQFGVSPETIMEQNNLTTDGISPEMELVIPLCEGTPSRTASTPSNTMTITAISGTIFPAQPE